MAAGWSPVYSDVLSHDPCGTIVISNPPSDSRISGAQADAAAHGGEPLRFATARRVVEVPGPRRFLDLFEGVPRGMWARGPRWAAHAGLLATFETGPGRDRFAGIEAAVRARLGHWDGVDSLRVYGGFAFRDDHEPEGAWARFPVALFHLPRIEIDGEGSGLARLRVRCAVSGTLGEARQEAEAEADRLTQQLAQRTEDPVPTPITGETEQAGWDAWKTAIESTLERISEGVISKAVLARTRDVRLKGKISPVDLVHSLWSQHTGTHAFFFEPQIGVALLGAAPEAIATLRDGRISATAVAGSTGVGETDSDRHELGNRLLKSAKDLAEHRSVVLDMVERLSPLADAVRAQEAPHVLSLARIQHLETEIEAVAPEGRSVLDLVEALHPTPAVCGVPRDAAEHVIHETEPFDRGWYAGPVGWFDTEGNGHFVPALRTAVGDGESWRLFAGAGIVQGSEPVSEWEETGIKFEPVLRALESCGARIAQHESPDPTEAR